ncbi:MAG: hypothetical protein V7707_20565 [Motiliproteus sp.]
MCVDGFVSPRRAGSFFVRSHKERNQEKTSPRLADYVGSLRLLLVDGRIGNSDASHPQTTAALFHRQAAMLVFVERGLVFRWLLVMADGFIPPCRAGSFFV